MGLTILSCFLYLHFTSVYAIKNETVSNFILCEIFDVGHFYGKLPRNLTDIKEADLPALCLETLKAC